MGIRRNGTLSRRCTSNDRALVNVFSDPVYRRGLRMGGVHASLDAQGSRQTELPV